MNRLSKMIAPYVQPRIMGILLLGFSSGLPFLLTLATLHLWLAEVGVTKSTIGLFALVTIPYSLKFMWAPLVDRIKFPFFSDLFGHLKGWMIASQIALMGALFLMGHTNPQNGVLLTAFCALCVSFFSATQDIVTEAFRVERLEGHETGYGAGATNLGYRLGMWASGAGALYLAACFSWTVAYGFMAGLMLIGLITAFLSEEPNRPQRDILLYHKTKDSLLKTYQKLMTPSFKSLLENKNILDLAFYILFYKLIDTALNVMAAPFLIEIGFTKIEIAHVGKSFGIGAMIVGGLIGGILLSTKPLRHALLLGLTLQLISAFLFYIQYLVGANLYLLFATIGIENLTNGIGAAAFITLLSHAARGKNTAMHFALLTSFASFARVIFSYLSGVCADSFGWEQYYLLVALLCLPGVFLLGYNRNAAFTPAFESLQVQK